MSVSNVVDWMLCGLTVGLKKTGHAPQSVIAVLSEDTVVVTLHEALTPAEKLLARNPTGAAQVQQFHRQLFANSSNLLRQEIKRTTRAQNCGVEAITEVVTATGTVVHAFTTGAIVRVFLLASGAGAESRGESTPSVA